MEKTLQVLNELERDGHVGRYAIGGAMAATFYAEPIVTFDLDVFVVLPSTTSGLITLEPLYRELARRKYQFREECVDIEGVPVRFIAPYNALVEEALVSARNTQYGSTPTRVLTVEHLIAIALQTGRDKDRERVTLLRRGSFDEALLTSIVLRYDLKARWDQWKS
jgi:hypothetical protein